MALVQVEKDSISILNITLVELAGNRCSINQLGKDFEKIQVGLENITETFMIRVLDLEDYIRKYLHFSTIINQMHQRKQTFLGSIRDLRVQLDMLFLGHLSPNIVDPMLLRDHLLEVQAKLPHHLKLPANPVTELWHYYSSLGCLNLVENSRLLIVVSLPLLDSSNIYEVFQVINLPILYPRRKQDSGTVTKYK